MQPDANIYNRIVTSPFNKAIGRQEADRINAEIQLYNRYDGSLNVWTHYFKPAGIDYEPTKLNINYLHKLIDTIAAWQFEKEPKVSCPPEQIDASSTVLSPDYQPSAEQQAENERAKAREKLLQLVWNENSMHAQLLSAAKDRSITRTGVYARLHYDTRRGKLKIFFHPSIEVIPVYDPFDAQQMTQCHFVAWLDPNCTILWKLSYWLEWDENAGVYDCQVSEGIYNSDLELTEERLPRVSMGLDFIPVVRFPTDHLVGQTEGYSELEKLIDIQDEINRKFSDYSDALRFSMFSIKVLTDVDVDPKDPLKVAPSAVWNLGNTDGEGKTPKAQNLESTFNFDTTLNTYIDRLYAAMRELSEVPSFNASELNAGGLNDYAVQVMFSAIISKTQRAWIIWQAGLQQLNRYILRYMQARQDHERFSYDKTLLATAVDGNDYDSKIIFGLPLPTDQKALIEQLSEEISNDIESTKGAIARSGKSNPEAKLAEIMAERAMMQKAEDPYNEEQQK